MQSGFSSVKVKTEFPVTSIKREHDSDSDCSVELLPEPLCNKRQRSMDQPGKECQSLEMIKEREQEKDTPDIVETFDTLFDKFCSKIKEDSRKFFADVILKCTQEIIPINKDTMKIGPEKPAMIQSDKSTKVPRQQEMTVNHKTPVDTQHNVITKLLTDKEMGQNKIYEIRNVKKRDHNYQQSFYYQISDANDQLITQAGLKSAVACATVKLGNHGFQCMLCHSKFRAADLLAYHVREHMKLAFRCYYCNYRVLTLEEYRRHCGEYHWDLGFAPKPTSLRNFPALLKVKDPSTITKTVQPKKRGNKTEKQKRWSYKRSQRPRNGGK